jgi:hypothetical protein
MHSIRDPHTPTPERNLATLNEFRQARVQNPGFLTLARRREWEFV